MDSVGASPISSPALGRKKSRIKRAFGQALSWSNRDRTRDSEPSDDEPEQLVGSLPTKSPALSVRRSHFFSSTNTKNRDQRRSGPLLLERPVQYSTLPSFRNDELDKINVEESDSDEENSVGSHERDSPSINLSSKLAALPPLANMSRAIHGRLTASAPNVPHLRTREVPSHLAVTNSASTPITRTESSSYDITEDYTTDTVDHQEEGYRSEEQIDDAGKLDEKPPNESEYIDVLPGRRRPLKKNNPAQKYSNYNATSSDEDENNTGEANTSVEEPVSNYNEMHFSNEFLFESDRLCLPRELTTDIDRMKWNKIFGQLWSKVVSSTKAAEKTYAKISYLFQEFLRTAQLYGKIIVNEKFLPSEMKTVKPCSLGGTAGGEKYICEGILFKFANGSATLEFDENSSTTDGRRNDNLTFRLYGGAMNAAKSAALELRSINAMFNLELPNISFPLFVVLDYRGFRLSAMSLLPVSNSTLVYGSDDGGRTLHDNDPTLSSIIDHIGHRLNLKAHLAGTQIGSTKYVPFPADAEGHVGTDGNMYILDTARLMPPEPPSTPSSFLYRHFRPEFVMNYPKSLCSDGHSLFVRHDPDRTLYKEEIKEAHYFLLNVIIPSFACVLDTEYSIVDSMTDSLSLPRMMHRKGINMRMLGVLWQSTTSPYWKKRIINEMAYRIAKGTLRTLMRSAVERVKLPTEEPYVRVVVDYLNLLLGNSTATTAYWAREIKYSTLLSYFYHILPPGQPLPAQLDKLSDLSFYNEDMLSHIDKSRLLRELTEKSGILLERSKGVYLQSCSHGQHSLFMEEKPFNMSDIVSISPTTKPLDLLQISEAFMLFLKPNRTVDNLRTIATTLNDFSSVNYASCSSYLIPLYCSEAYFLLMISLLETSDVMTQELRVVERRICSKISGIIYDTDMFNSACRVDPYFYENLWRMIFECAQYTETLVRSSMKDSKHMNALSLSAHSALSVISPNLDGKVQAALQNTAVSSTPMEWKLNLLYNFMSRAAKTLVAAYSLTGREGRFREFQGKMKRILMTIPTSHQGLFQQVGFQAEPTGHIAMKPLSTSSMVRHIEYLLGQKNFGRDLLGGKLRQLLDAKKYVTILRMLREETKGRDPSQSQISVVRDEHLFWSNVVAVLSYHYQERKIQVLMELKNTYMLLLAHPLVSEVHYMTQSANAEEQIAKIDERLSSISKKRTTLLPNGLPISRQMSSIPHTLSTPPFDRVKTAWGDAVRAACTLLEPTCSAFYRNFIGNLVDRVLAKYATQIPFRMLPIVSGKTVGRDTVQNYAKSVANSLCSQFFQEELAGKLSTAIRDSFVLFAQHLQSYNLNDSFKNIFLSCLGYQAEGGNSYLDRSVRRLTDEIEDMVRVSEVMTNRIPNIRELEAGPTARAKLEEYLSVGTWMLSLIDFIKLIRELLQRHMNQVQLVRTLTGFENYTVFVTGKLKGLAATK
ncbi:hypothetical protein PROFUN_01737 [Planoprotostelium fungivorum]|uniref:Clu domain-containing protein n=1 Tax=Planoprotostelium fungivorum TaxID=1890364 RepID=A0A2P6MWD0_9EUKA|nr:hypothetical protein PROFUN_01737 [Planoprotostelium fungivorum]